MPKLELRFEKQILGEYPVVGRPLTIGRSPGNDIVIDNLAVSNEHARVISVGDHFTVEDLQSLNGTFVNNRKVAHKTVLRDGDLIGIGKHTLVFFEFAESAAAPAAPKASGPTPKIDETFVLETKKRVDLLKDPTEATAVSKRVPLAQLKVLQGKTDQSEYMLTSKLTLIGKSEMASIRLRGWFKPKTAGVINRKEDGYYVGPASEKSNVSVNGMTIKHPHKLHDGDIIEVAGVRFVFTQVSQ